MPLARLLSTNASLTSAVQLGKVPAAYDYVFTDSVTVTLRVSSDADVVL